MPRVPRRKIAKWVYRVGGSLIGKVQVGSGDTALQTEKPFDPDTATKEIQRWAETERQRLLKLRAGVVRGSIAADVPVYLKDQEHKESYASKKSELGAWVKELGSMRRHQVRETHIVGVISRWLAAGVSKKTIVNRCRTLHHFFVTLLGDKKARTPLDNVEIPKPDKRRPQPVAAALIIRTEKNLRATVALAQQRLAKEMKKPAEQRKPRQFVLEAANAARAHGRFMVQATDGVRPSQMRRVEPDDVDLANRLVQVRPGKGGLPIVIAMNDESLAAWRAFVDADAFGSYDDSKYRRRLRSAGWPKGLDPYMTKHTVGIALAEAGADHEDIKDRFGHTDTKTVKIYTGTPVKRLRRVAALIDHRFGWAKTPRTTPRGDDNRGALLTNTGAKSRSGRTQRSSRSAEGKRRKSA